MIRWKMGSGYLVIFAHEMVSVDVCYVVAGGYPEALRLEPTARTKCQWFTMFRHPIARLVSAFYFCRAVPKDQACASEVVNAKDIDITASQSIGETSLCGNFR